MTKTDKGIMLDSERLDRQLRIEGWDQSALDRARVAVVADSGLVSSIFIMCASALGINSIVAICPNLEPELVFAAERLNPRLNLTFLKGLYTHPALEDIFEGAGLIVDLSRTGITNKLLLNKCFRDNIPLIRGFYFSGNGEEGVRVFTYLRGREVEELSGVVYPKNLPGARYEDGVFSLIVTGLVLEETKNILMGLKSSEKLITYRRKTPPGKTRDTDICVVGAGALGNFCGLGLALSGFESVTFMDPDIIETTNLNRQVLFYGAVGESKAATLAERLNSIFGTRFGARVEYLKNETDVSNYDAILDCVDNFETRIVLSERCKREEKVFISGGTSMDAGQVVVYDPVHSSETPAELLGLYDIVETRDVEANRWERQSCIYQPDPSVIMPNLIIAGLMVDLLRTMLGGFSPRNLFYDSKHDERFL